MKLELPGCGVVEADGEQAQALLAAGFRPVKPDEEKRPPAKRRTRRATNTKTTE